MVQRLGDGRKAQFWEGAWSGEKMLKELFPRLFLLSTSKKGSVSEMGRWEDGSWSWWLRWRRPLFEWEHDLENELMIFLGNFSIKAGISDSWI